MVKKESRHENKPLTAATSYGQMQIYRPDDEIDLRELWQTVRKRKRIVFITVVLFLTAAFLYILLAKPVYQAEATIEIGKELVKVNGGTLVARYFDNANNIKRYIDVQYDTAGKYRKKGSTAYIEKVSIDKRAAGFLTITALGQNNASAVKMLQKPINEIYTKHIAIMKSILENKIGAIDDIKQQINYDTNVLLPQLKSSLNSFQTVETKKIDDQIKFIKTKKIPALETNIKEFEKEIIDKEQSIKNMQLYITKTAKKHPSFAAMTASKISNFKNSITHLRMQIIDFHSRIKTLQYATTPNLNTTNETKTLQYATTPNLNTTNETKTVQYGTIPDLKAAKNRLLKEIIPAKQTAIKNIESVTIPQLKLKIKQIQAHMKAPYIVMTHIVGKIYTHTKPIKPKKKLIIVVALITGLIFGIFLVFFLEFIGNVDKVITAE